jgi:hypothetical protein
MVIDLSYCEHHERAVAHVGAYTQTTMLGERVDAGVRLSVKRFITRGFKLNRRTGMDLMGKIRQECSSRG